MKNLLILGIFVQIVCNVSTLLAQKTKYIHSDRTVWGDKPRIILEHKLRIGGFNVTDDEYLMRNIKEAFIDKEGRVCILDGGNNRVQIFSAEGTYLKTIGRAGQGPGEFQIPISFDQDNKGNYIILNGRIQNVRLVSSDGVEFKRTNVPRFVGKVRFVENGDYVIAALPKSRGGFRAYAPEPLFKIFDQNGQKIREFLETDPGVAKYRGRDLLYSSTGIHYETDGEYIYYSFDIKNIIRKVDLKGNILYEISRKLNYDVEKKEAIQKGNKLYHSNWVARGIAIDGQGRIWVGTYKKQINGLDMNDRISLQKSRYAVYKDYCVFEVFSPEGLLLGEVPLPMDMYSFRIQGDKLLAVDLDMISVHIFDIVENGYQK